jgi:hypothetical protein
MRGFFGLFDQMLVQQIYSIPDIIQRCVIFLLSQIKLIWAWQSIVLFLKKELDAALEI